MMKRDKILLTVNNLDDINYFKELEVSNFLFPLENYVVGYDTFSLKEIEKSKVKAYLLINRLLTDDDIDEFLKLVLPSNVVGLVIEDVGLYYSLKDCNLELINFQNHLNNSFETINFWLDYYDSIVLSTDITYDEINTIVNNSKKPVVINTFGYPMIMYSRRKLITNFYEHNNETPSESLNIDIPNQVKFKLKENEYGTAVFDDHLLDIRKESLNINEEKIKFYLINSAFLNRDILESAIKGEKIENTTLGFLNTKTIYRIGDIK